MKKEKSGLKVLILIGLFIFCFCLVLIGIFIIRKSEERIDSPNNNSASNSETADGTQVNDFYEYANNGIIQNGKLDEDEGYWGVFLTETQDRVNEKVENIVKEIVDPKNVYDENSNEYKMQKLYNSYLNLEKESNLEIISKYIDIIESSSNVNELLNNIMKIGQEIGLSYIIPVGLVKDFKDNSKIALAISPFVYDFGMSNSDIYNNPMYASYSSMFIGYDRKILELYGYSEEEAKESVKEISKLYTTIAKASKSQEEMAEVSSTYNVITLNELKDIYSNIDIESFISEFNGYDVIFISDKDQAVALNNYLVDSNLNTLKECVKLQMLQDCSSLLNMEYHDLINELNAALMGTEVSTDTLEDEAIDVIIANFDTDITLRYIDKYVKDGSTEYFENMIEDIIKQYKTKIASNTWLTEATKQKAILKLDNMKINVGYPDEFPQVAKRYEIGDNVLQNYFNIIVTTNQFSKESILNKKDYWLMSALTVNAYYNPQDNSINFPIALLEYELYDEKNTYYQNLGSLGAVIGHEISHSFDNNGALFDEKGNMNNWWTEEDYSKFEALQQEVTKYYNKYEVNGKKVNGKLTVSENIADLGGLSCVVEIAKGKGASTKDMKELFTAYANIWASKATKQYLTLMMMSDTHSPDKVRVNAVVSSIDEFYNTYGIKEGDGMYKAANERVKVW